MKNIEDDELVGVCAHIGNVIRLAAIVGIDEVEAACRQSEDAGIHAMLLDPTQTPESDAAARQNLRLLGAFRAFRSEIQCIAEWARGRLGEMPAPAASVLSDGAEVPDPPPFIGVREDR